MTKAPLVYMGQQRPAVSPLIAIGNAMLNFGIIQEPWDQDGPEFQKLVELCGATSSEEIVENLDRLAEEFGLRVDCYTALEISKELVAKLLDDGKVVSLPIWDEKVGLHSVLIAAHDRGLVFEVINRYPFTEEPAVGVLAWEELGYRRWNVPVRVYGRRA